MFKRVLVPITDSRPNLEALDQAIDLAARRKLTLIGLNVLTPDLVSAAGIGPAGFTGSGYVDSAEYELDERATQLREQAQQKLLDSFKARCHARNVGCVPLADSLSPADDIVRWAEDVDLVWLSHQGVHHSRTTWLSTFEEVVRRSPVPVWVAQVGAHQPQRLTVAFDGHPQALGALDAAAALSREWSLPLELLVVSEGRDMDVNEETLREAQAVLKAFGREPDTATLIQGHAAEVLTNATAPDRLLVMGTHSHGTFLGFRRGHTVDEVLQGAHGPVLLCPKETQTYEDD